MKQYIYNHPNIKLNITSLGRSTTRFQSIIHFSNKLILPVTTSLVVYDLMTLKELERKQTNESVIYCVNQTEQFILSIGYGGDICKLDKKTFEILQIINFNIGNQCRWSSINDNLMAMSAERSNKKGCIQIIDVEKMVQLRVFNGRYCYGSIIRREKGVQYYVLKEYKHKKLSQEEKSKLNQKERQLRKHNQKYIYGLEIYGEGDDRIQEIMFPPPECEILLMAQSNDYLGYIYQDRRCCFVDLNNNNEMTIVKFEGAGSIQCCCFHNNNLVFSPKNKELCIYNVKEKSTTIYKIPQLYECPQGIINMDNITILTTEGQILIVDNKGNLIVNQEFGGITKCGIDFFKDDQVVSGDFAGNLSIQKINSQEIEQIFVGIPIRCVTCSGNIIYVGTMDGSLYIVENGNLKLFSNLEGSITCIRVKDNYILASTTHGIVALFEGENQLKFLGHPPQNRSELFGSLDKYADIWSCIFDPCNDRFATASEDQTVKVFNYQGQEIITLKGHTLAVTCLDWKQGKLGLILYSCSDDRTIRMYDKQFELIHQFNTYFVNEWHTLTYMCIIGDIVSIGAQNGYLYLYDIIQKSFKFANKIHMGGIEGLCSKQLNNIIGTCSSDDTINIIQL